MVFIWLFNKERYIYCWPVIWEKSDGRPQKTSWETLPVKKIAAKLKATAEVALE